jgi:hypothetical protein
VIDFAAVAVGPGEIRLGGERLASVPDPRTGTAEVAWAGAGWRLRPWTFAERRRLLAAHLGPAGDLDTDGVVAAAARLLVEPPADDPVLGLAALAWSAGPGGGPPAPVPPVDPAAQTVALARATGWRPGDVDGAAAADVDRWFAAVHAAPPPAAGPDDDGFVSYRLEPGS